MLSAIFPAIMRYWDLYKITINATHGHEPWSLRLMYKAIVHGIFSGSL